MKRIDKLFACLLAITVFASCPIHAQDESSFVDEYLQQFLSALSITESTNTTNSTIWTPRSLFSSAGCCFPYPRLSRERPNCVARSMLPHPKTTCPFRSTAIKHRPNERPCRC